MKSFFFFISLFISLGVASIVAGEDWESNGIPADAKKYGPISTPNPQEEIYLYYPAGVELSDENLISREVFHKKILIERVLLKNEKEHGVQLKWHENGKRKSEEPFRDGRMEGTFREWDERGNLVAMYTMRGGSGVATRYSSTGRLILMRQYVDNKKDGLHLTSVNDTISIESYKAGILSGSGCQFSEDGSLLSIGFISNDGVHNGPIISFSKDRSVTWFIKNREVSKEEYAKAALGNSELPPVMAHLDEYKQLIPKETLALLDKYRRMSRIVIPLQFDKDGNPVVAK